ncbi:hypothetical protein LMTR13_07775 [Bradyrhizobium icense]|uniref:Uncharacterized protein n=1 Tax=Bradyrhizobium icense TaxID=1274631 RepID=A0A1B1UBE6_9BRAD|nr:hypothetical protein LMTR13_07775 [Bradyrhizobium icense]
MRTKLEQANLKGQAESGGFAHFALTIPGFRGSKQLREFAYWKRYYPAFDVESYLQRPYGRLKTLPFW